MLTALRLHHPCADLHDRRNLLDLVQNVRILRQSTCTPHLTYFLQRHLSWAAVWSLLAEIILLGLHPMRHHLAHSASRWWRYVFAIQWE